ncbi:MAG: ABC transporter substrate-binding protein [Bacteroidales bacterium]|nr:ABC transporter substrate-binding protein [Candidatus Minthousia equi]
MKQYFLMILLLLLTACQGGKTTQMQADSNAIQLEYAANITMQQGEGYILATLKNPWKENTILQTYVLVPKDQELPDNLPQGTVVRTPLNNALVYASVHCGLISQLGEEERIGGVCDREYIKLQSLQQRIDKGLAYDCGSNFTPNIERIIQMHPEAILLSPYETSGDYGKLGQLGIPLVQCADYMETSPLGRAEWVKFYGILFGCEQQADSLFKEVSSDYLHLKEMAQKTSTRPSVLSDTRYGQVWHQPAGNSTIGRLYVDAGATNPFGNNPESGSVALSSEQVFAQAHDADIWLVKYNAPQNRTLEELKNDADIHAQFKAFQTGNVYGCNTQTRNYYEETPYHPNYLLRDMIMMFHPELGLEGSLRYYEKLKP